MGEPTGLTVESIPTCPLPVISKLSSWRKNKLLLKFPLQQNQKRKRFLKRSSRDKSFKWTEVRVPCKFVTFQEINVSPWLTKKKKKKKKIFPLVKKKKKKKKKKK